MTDAYYDETTGALEYDATLDNGPDGLHCMVLYPSEDSFYDDNDSTVLEYGTGPHLVEWLAGHIFLAHEMKLQDEGWAPS
jgi:hypothetical protein